MHVVLFHLFFFKTEAQLNGELIFNKNIFSRNIQKQNIGKKDEIMLQRCFFVGQFIKNRVSIADLDINLKMSIE